MSRIVAQFDPTPGSGSFSAAAVNRCSALLFMNESANFLTLDFGGAFPPMILQPWSNRLVRLAQPVQTVYWTVAATLQSSDAPVSQVYVEAFDPSETLDGITSGPLFRQTNVGNAVSTSASTPNSLEQDMLTPFVYGASSFVATKDGTLANQLDMTGGVALLRQSDQSIGRVAPAATTFETTTPNATYFLDLQPDGSFSFGTTHSGQPNYLSIAQVTTDASGNISGVTDERTLITSFLSAGQTPVEFGELNLSPVGIETAPTNDARLTNFTFGGTQTVILKTNQSGAQTGFAVANWDGSHLQIPFGVGANQFGATFLVNTNGSVGVVGGQASAGSFGVPVIVAQHDGMAVTTTALQTLCSFTPPTTGLYRVNIYISANGVNPSVISAYVQYTSPIVGLHTHNFDCERAGTFLQLNASSIGTPTELLPFSMLVRATSASAITIFYQNTTATPNDQVSGFIERLT